MAIIIINHTQKPLLTHAGVSASTAEQPGSRQLQQDPSAQPCVHSEQSRCRGGDPLGLSQQSANNQPTCINTEHAANTAGSMMFVLGSGLFVVRIFTVWTLSGHRHSFCLH